ncbi:Hypothetical predicted protein, partial [Paramuricea clavata]
VNPHDPGVCDAKSRGKEIVVKDRYDNDQLVVCLEQDGKYKWQMLKAKDCSDVVDNVRNAESGPYWIKTRNKSPRKAWCDVVTDGGGFILIGVKDTPVTWAIPSKPTYIDPNGRSQWSSAFGDKL